MSNAEDLSSPELRFAFGKNWQSFVDTALNEQRVAGAVASLRRLLNGEDLRGKLFLDIGCGSGLSSLSLGAERVAGFDYDPNSVAASTGDRGVLDLSHNDFETVNHQQKGT